MITLFWTLLFCDGSQRITYIDPADNTDASVVYGYIVGAADSMLYFPATDLYVCGYWITKENES